MNSQKFNIKLSYLYRDAGNYKQFGEVIFSNPNRLSCEEIETRIRKNLIDGEWFDHVQCSLPSCFFDDVNEDDHEWHEFKSVEITGETCNDNRTVEVFLKLISHEN